MKYLSLTIILYLIAQSNLLSQNFFRAEISATDFREVTLLQAIQNLQRKSKDVDKSKNGFNYIFTKKASQFVNKKITLNLSKIPLHDAIKYTLLTLNLEAKYEFRNLIIFAPGEKYKNPVIQEKFIKRDPRLLSSLKLPLKEISADGTALRDVLKEVKAQSAESDRSNKGVNMLDVSGAASQKISMHLKKVSVYEAIRYSALAAGVAMKIDRSAVVLQKK